MIKWDLGKPFSPLQWQNATKWAHGSSACANHKEQYQKILTRWYFPNFQSIPNGIFNTSILELSFWSQVFTLLTSITGPPIPKTPELTLLLINIEVIPVVHPTVVCNVLHAAQLCIARYWKSDKPPSHMEVQEIVSNIYLQERTLAWHTTTSNTFRKKWALCRRRFPTLAS